jgi:predicted HTH domain antitoxin
MATKGKAPRKKQPQVTLSSELAGLLSQSSADLTARVNEATAILLFQEGALSSRKAAEILGISWDEFLDGLIQRQIPYFRQSIEEVLEDADVAASARWARPRP